MSQDVPTPQEVDLYSPLDPDALPDDLEEDELDAPSEAEAAPAAASEVAS